MPNSGGYGDPVERDPQLVRSDVLDGFTTVERAERDYRVVIDPDTLEVDLAATARPREERTAAPVPNLLEHPRPDPQEVAVLLPRVEDQLDRAQLAAPTPVKH